MDKDKKSFVFYVEWRDVLMDYPAEVRYEVYDAIIEYAASGKLSELKPLAKMAFSFIKKDMDRNQDKYNGKVETNRENGKKGGAPLGNSNARRKQPKTTETTQNNRTVEQTTETTLNENDNDNVNENGNNNPPSIPPLKSGDSVADAPDASENGRRKVIEEKFEAFRKLYPGTKRGFETEYKNFIKKHKDYASIIDLLKPAIEKEIKWHETRLKNGMFTPEYANLSTWINQKRWEYELEPINEKKHETNKTESQSYDNGGFLD